jgi:hypothetical protein
MHDLVEGEYDSEKDISTEKYCAKASPWIPRPYEYEGRTLSPEATTRKRTETFNRINPFDL